MKMWISMFAVVACLTATCFGQEQDKPPTAEKPAAAAEKGTSPKPNDEPVTVRGVVREVHQSPKGDVDGFVFADGSEVRFPPHMGEKVTAAVTKGDEIEVTGRKHTGPKGDTHVRSEAIKNLKSGATVKMDPPPKPEGKKGHEGAEGKPMPPHEQILAEVRSLRAMVEGKAKPKPHHEAKKPKEPPHEQVLKELRDLRKVIEKRLGGNAKPAGPEKIKEPRHQP